MGHCNHRCTFCAVDYIGYKTRSLDADVLIHNLTDMAGHGVKSVMFAGEGEPLLHPKLDSVINHCKSVSIDVGITTNGVALTERFVESCLSNVAWVKVSCNAGNKETYERVHRASGKDWDTVWKNLTRARAWVNKERANTVSDTVLGIQAVMIPENKDSLVELAKRARDTGLDYIVIKPYSQHKKSLTREYAEIRYKELMEGLKEVEKVTGEGFEVIVRHNSMEVWDRQDGGYEKCLSTPYFWAYIMATGDVYGCSAYLLDDRFKYGSIKDNLFSEIWLGDKRKESMEYVDRELDISECRKNCRMDKVNRYLWELENPDTHRNFI